eukprot:3556064-Prymnesium_polylepis.1
MAPTWRPHRLARPTSFGRRALQSRAASTTFGYPPSAGSGRQCRVNPTRAPCATRTARSHRSSTTIASKSAPSLTAYVHRGRRSTRAAR